MPLFSVLIILALVGLLAWALTTYIPMPDGVKRLIIIVAIAVCVLWVLSLFGFTLSSMPGPRVGHAAS